MFLTYQSKIRPTKGEIRVTPASAQATAYKNNNNIRRGECVPDRMQKEEWDCNECHTALPIFYKKGVYN